MADLASVSDLEVLMKRAFSGADRDQAEMVVAAVSAWARAVAGQEWSAAPAGVPSDVKYVVLAASRRTLRNPDGVTAESMGPFSKSYDKPPAEFFTPAELSILKRYRPKASGHGLFTLGFTRGEQGTARRIVHLFLDGDEENPMPTFWPGEPNYEESWHLD